MSVRIPLAAPVEWGGALVHEIELAPPTFGNLVACGGEPYEWLRSAGGTTQFVIDYERVEKLLKVLVKSPGGYALVAGLPVEDGNKVLAALIDFFMTPAAAPSPDMSTSSSST